MIASFVWSMLVPRIAVAERPTEGGMFSFDQADDVRNWDEPSGAIRVHYSVEGPNVTLLADADADGVPDYPQDVARTAAEVLQFFATERGLLRPVGEQALGLGELGGSYALDIYLVDFAGNADGSFGLDMCRESPDQCAGYLVIENDFEGYSYTTLDEAINVLTSHELFHAVQYAYTAGLPVWMSEGTAVWAEKQWDPASKDFLRFASAYFRYTARSLDRPPGGPVPTFAYSTGLWFDFATTRHGTTLISDLLNAVAEPGGDEVDVLAEMETVLGGVDDLRTDWLDFAAWNLATGSRAGTAESYEYAAALPGVTAKAEGSAIDDDNRFYPLATTYYRLDHAGGPIWFGVEEAAPGLDLALFPVADGAGDGPVGPSAAAWTADRANSWPVADGVDFARGGYWIVASQAARAEQSIKVRICVGDADTAADCAPPIDGDSGGCSISSPGSSSSQWLFIISAVFLARMGRSQCWALRRR